MNKKPWSLVIVAASALAALAVGVGAQGATEPQETVLYAARTLFGGS